MNTNKIDVAVNELLEILYIISHDGHYSDEEALINTLEALGVTKEKIQYHQKQADIN